jgi:CheY-like chemotaxis protein
MSGPRNKSETRPLRLLIADDSGAIRRILGQLISSSAGNWVVCGEATNGQDAVKKCAELRPNAILLDLSLPLLSGLDAVKAIRREKLPVTPILMSAQEQDVLRRIAGAAQVPYSISKSMLIEGLIPLLQSISLQAPSGREAA